jgi:hypothetical protein
LWFPILGAKDKNAPRMGHPFLCFVESGWLRVVVSHTALDYGVEESGTVGEKAGR